LDPQMDPRWVYAIQRGTNGNQRGLSTSQNEPCASDNLVAIW
jgi:hypothetical protein